jgi:hypothetical protein
MEGSLNTVKFGEAGHVHSPQNDDTYPVCSNGCKLVCSSFFFLYKYLRCSHP